MWMRSCAACKALLHKPRLCDSQRVVPVSEAKQPASVIETESFIFPGLIDLHESMIWIAKACNSPRPVADLV
jgi:hypothetical protein